MCPHMKVDLYKFNSTVLGCYWELYFLIHYELRTTLRLVS